LTCAKAKWDFEGIAEERAVGNVVAHDMARRDEEGLEAMREGCLYDPPGQWRVVPFQRRHSGMIPCSFTAPVLSVYRTRGDKAE